MQFNPKTCLRTFDQYANIDFKPEKHEIKTKIEKRKSLRFSGYSVTLDNVLTKAECQQLIENSNKAGYQTLKHEYDVKQRDNDRILSINKELAKTIWDRIKAHDEWTKYKPFGFFVAGTWKPERINECFRFSRYQSPSIGFKPHYDSPYIENADHRSALTIIIYLNDHYDYNDGETVLYYPNEQRIEATAEEEMKNGYREIVKIEPQTGMAFIFSHDCMHAGLPVTKGAKYIIRSDIIYERIDKIPKIKIENYEEHEKIWFLRAMHYYREAGNLEVKGEIQKAGEMYERALSIRKWFGDDGRYLGGLPLDEPRK